jgi:hypothetical protein
MAIAHEQGGFPFRKAICPWCNKPGACEPHHWLFKRSSGVSDEVLHNPANIVLLHNLCHRLWGQTKFMKQICAEHKITLGYDLLSWLADLLAAGEIKHMPPIWNEEPK